jgi:hypothetical protein
MQSCSTPRGKKVGIYSFSRRQRVSDADMLPNESERLICA